MTQNANSLIIVVQSEFVMMIGDMAKLLLLGESFTIKPLGRQQIDFDMMRAKSLIRAEEEYIQEKAKHLPELYKNLRKLQDLKRLEILAHREEHKWKKEISITKLEFRMRTGQPYVALIKVIYQAKIEHALRNAGFNNFSFIEPSYKYSFECILRGRPVARVLDKINNPQRQCVAIGEDYILIKILNSTPAPMKVTNKLWDVIFSE